MRYLYGAADEKYVKSDVTESNEEPSPLSSYKFHLDTITEGKPEIDKNDIQIIFKCTPDTLLNLCAKIVDALPLPSVYEWNIDDICKWLRGYGYRQYQNTFRENFITGRTFLLLDASALSAMNIRDFEHIKHIAYGIRSLFFFEMTKFGRSITHYPEFHNEIYKLFRIKTGAKYDNIRRLDLWRRLQIIRKKTPNYSHWSILERWLGFDKDPEFPELFGGIHRHNLYICSAKPKSPITAKRPQQCFCVPPCECSWSKTDRRPPWTLKCLPHLLPDKEFVETCKGCVPPCTCRWTSKKYTTRGDLSCLQVAFPQKYGQLGRQRQRAGRFDTLPTYRLSLL